MGRGPGTFPEFACRRVCLLVEYSFVRDFMKMYLCVRGFSEDFTRVRYFGEMFMDLYEAFIWEVLPGKPDPESLTRKVLCRRRHKTYVHPSPEEA